LESPANLEEIATFKKDNVPWISIVGIVLRRATPIPLITWRMMILKLIVGRTQ
jgi:hypothetical protein